MADKQLGLIALYSTCMEPADQDLRNLHGHLDIVLKCHWQLTGGFEAKF